MATNATAKIRIIEAAGGGCNGPINNGRERSRTATRIIITNELAPHPYFSIFIDRSLFDLQCHQNLTGRKEKEKEKSHACTHLGGCHFIGHINRLHGVAWEREATVG